MHEVFEQEHQHDVDTQHASQHGQAEARHHFSLHLGIANLHLLHTGWQIHDAGQLGYRRRHFAQRHARQFYLEVDITHPVQAAHHRRPARHLEAGNLAEHHRPFDARHHQAAQQFQVLARRSVELDHNGNLTLAQVEFGQRRLVIAHSGDAQGLGNSAASNAHFGSLGKVGPDGDFSAGQAGTGADVAQASDLAQVFFYRCGRLCQGYWIFALEGQHVFFARATEAHFKTGARQDHQGFAHGAFNGLLARALAALIQQHRKRCLAYLGTGAAHKRVNAHRAATGRGVDAFYMGNFDNQRARLLCRGVGLRQRAARWQLQVNLGL